MSEQQTYWLMTWHATQKTRIHKRVHAGTYTIGSADDNFVVLPEPDVAPHHGEIIIEADNRLFYRDMTVSSERQRLMPGQVHTFQRFFVMLMPVPGVPSLKTLADEQEPATRADENERLAVTPLSDPPATDEPKIIDPLFPVRGSLPVEYLIEDLVNQKHTPTDDTTTKQADDQPDTPAVNAEEKPALADTPQEPAEAENVIMSASIASAEYENIARSIVEAAKRAQTQRVQPDTPQTAPVTTPSSPTSGADTPENPYELLPLDEPASEESQYTLPKDWNDQESSLSVQLHRKSLRFVPGERVRIPVSVRNNSPTVGLKLRVSLHGLPFGWQTDIPPVFSLAPGEIKPLRVILFNTEGRAGTEKQIQLYIEDVDVPNIRSHIKVPIILKKDRDLSCQLVLPVLSDVQTGYVAITNHTQTQTQVAISADFDTSEALIFVHETTVEVAPHQTVRVPYTIDVYERHLFQRKPHLYWIAVAPRTRTTLDYPGTIVIEPVLDRARLLMIGLGIALLVLALAILVLGG